MTKGTSNMVGNDVIESHGDDDWLECCWVSFIVEHICVSEVRLYARVNLTIVDTLEEKLDSRVDVRPIMIDDPDEDIQ